LDNLLGTLLAVLTGNLYPPYNSNTHSNTHHTHHWSVAAPSSEQAKVWSFCSQSRVPVVEDRVSWIGAYVVK